VTLIAKGLRHSYGGREVLSGIDLELGPGEVLGLLGPNGAGKSTTFAILAGRLRPGAGTVELSGTCLDGMPLWQRVRAGLGYLAQEPSVVRSMTVADNIGLVGGAVDVAQVLLRAGLSARASAPAGSLSGGERRRLEIARSLATKPRFLLMDEPFSGVDPVAVSGLAKTIRGLVEGGLGVLLTDHAVRAALGVCDRVVLLDQGRVMASGTPAEVAADERARDRYLGPDFGVA
jgi:lipopolysaccharide export system ATP-binding protein